MSDAGIEEVTFERSIGGGFASVEKVRRQAGQPGEMTDTAEGYQRLFGPPLTSLSFKHAAEVLRSQLELF